MVFVFVTLFSGGLARFCALLFSVRSVSVLFSSWWENLLCILDSKILPFKFVANISCLFRLKTICRFYFSFENLARSFSILLLTPFAIIFSGKRKDNLFQTLFTITLYSHHSLRKSHNYNVIFLALELFRLGSRAVGDWWLFWCLSGWLNFPIFYSSPSLSR